MQKIEDCKSRFNKLESANHLFGEELDHLNNQLKPHQDKFNQNHSYENYEKNQQSSLIAFTDFNNIDKKLELFAKRETLLEKRMNLL